MVFKDRKSAGIALAEALAPYADNAIAIGLPRGGVVVAAEVANALHIPLDIICPRKVGAPGNEEYALGAVTETGQAFLNFPVGPDTVQKEIAEAKRRLALYRGNRPPRNLSGKTVLLIDDGLATGSTMKAAIATARSENAAQIIVAVPVAPSHTRLPADAFLCLHSDPNFYAVGQFYRDFGPTSDAEVIALLKANFRI